jgi:putative transposase
VSNFTPEVVATPEATINDPLTELLKVGARNLLAQAVEAELATLLAKHEDNKLDDGRHAVVRNGYLPARTIQTGLGDVDIQVPKVRDRSNKGIKFNSNLLPPYLKRSTSIEEMLPWLYLKGLSTGDYGEALASLLGEEARGLSAGTISRLKSDWIDEHTLWRKQDLSAKKYVYFWADGIYSHVRMGQVQKVL